VGESCAVHGLLLPEPRFLLLAFGRFKVNDGLRVFLVKRARGGGRLDHGPAGYSEYNPGAEAPRLCTGRSIRNASVNTAEPGHHVVRVVFLPSARAQAAVPVRRPNDESGGGVPRGAQALLVTHAVSCCRQRGARPACKLKSIRAIIWMRYLFNWIR